MSMIDQLGQKPLAAKVKFFYCEMLDPTTGESKKPREIVSIADNFVRLELLQDTERAICLSDKKSAELFLQYIKKTNGGVDCVIKEGIKDV